jgi:hypothetical protein
VLPSVIMSRRVRLAAHFVSKRFINYYAARFYWRETIRKMTRAL